MQIRRRRTVAGAIGLALAVIATLIAGPTTATAATATNNPDFTANVMAPLEVTDFTQFGNQLATVKAYGVDAVTVDVWWGKVEAAGDNQFNWSYYDQVFSTITSRGLDIVPIFSFHQCGGNVGDTCNIPLPAWLNGKYTGATLNGITLDGNGLKHRSEQGNFSNETVQGWADQLVANEYQAFTQAFVARYGSTYASRMQEINVSLGPAGELRYPSYNGHDSGAGYPTRGALQSYSPLAIKSFQQWAISKYGTIAGVNAAWGTSPSSHPAPTQDGWSILCQLTAFTRSTAWLAGKYAIRTFCTPGLASRPRRHRASRPVARDERSRHVRGSGPVGVDLGLRPLPHRPGGDGGGDSRGVDAHGGLRGIHLPRSARSDVHLHELPQPRIPCEGGIHR